MGGWSIPSIIIGIVGALSGVYLRESVRKAYQQKMIATKLEAYLMEWIPDLTKGTFKDLISIGHTWGEKEREKLQASGTVGIKEVADEYDKVLSELKGAIKNGDARIRGPMEDLHRQIRSMSDVQFDYTLKMLHDSQESVLKNYQFISDDEAAVLSWFSANRVIPIKSSILSLIKSQLILLVTVRGLGTVNLQEMCNPTLKMIESAIYIGKYYLPLLQHVQAIRAKSMIRLTLSNLL